VKNIDTLKGSSLKTLWVHRAENNLISVAEEQHSEILGSLLIKINNIGRVGLVSCVAIKPHFRDTVANLQDLLGLLSLQSHALHEGLWHFSNTSCCFAATVRILLDSCENLCVYKDTPHPKNASGSCIIYMGV
jgi:hypothetical protein